MSDSLEKILKEINSSAISEEQAVKLLLDAITTESKTDDKSLYSLLIKEVICDFGTFCPNVDTKINKNTTLIECQLDSLALANLANKMKNKYQINIPATTLFESSTIDELVKNILISHKKNIFNYFNGINNEIIQEDKSDKNKLLTPIQEKSISPDNFEFLWNAAKQKMINQKKHLSTPWGQASSVIITKNSIQSEWICLGEGEPILLLGGLSCSEKIWEKQLSFLLKNHRVFVYQTPGHGKSNIDKTIDSLEGLATLVVQQYCQFFTQGKPLKVIGWSLGGILAMQLAITYPNLIKSLCIINSSTVWLDRDKNMQFALDEMKKLDSYLKNDLFILLDSETINYYKMLLQSANLVDSLCKIKCPTLIISGENDNYIKPENSIIIAEKIKQSTYVRINEAGHYSILTHANEINTLIENFINFQSKGGPYEQ